jgi:hypothetical protein
MAQTPQDQPRSFVVTTAQRRRSISNLPRHAAEPPLNLPTCTWPNEQKLAGERKTPAHHGASI